MGKGLKFQPDFCNGCHDVLMMSMSLGNIAILNINGAGYRSIINEISERKAIKLLQSADLIEKSGIL